MSAANHRMASSQPYFILNTIKRPYHFHLTKIGRPVHQGLYKCPPPSHCLSKLSLTNKRHTRFRINDFIISLNI